jgi:hypothetical protein
MKPTKRNLIAAAAIAGLLTGGIVSKTYGADAPAAGKEDKADKAAKHDCKGKNTCKGQGGCKSSANGCKGKNDCKGKGGCKTTEEKPK